MANKAATLADCFKPKKNYQESDHIKETKVSKENTEGIFWIGKSKEAGTPGWLDFCEDLSKIDLSSYKKQTISLSAIFAFKPSTTERIFIITFGYGNKYLNEDIIERNFGRNVVLNTADPDKFISLRSRSYSGTPWFKEHQAATPSNLLRFELDTNYDLVSRVTAEASTGIPKKYYDPSKPANKNILSNKFTGYDSLNLNSKVDIKELEGFCKWLEVKFKEIKYKDLIENIDAFNSIKSTSEIKELDGILIDALTDYNVPKKITKLKKDKSLLEINIQIAPPDLIDHEELEGFRYSRADLHDDEETIFSFDIADLISKLDTAEINEKLLKAIRVDAIRDGKVYKSWSLYHCISCELKFTDKTKIFLGKEWFSVEEDYISILITDLNKITHVKKVGTIDFNNKTYKDEDEFNKSQSTVTNWQLFDKKFLQLGGQNKLEVADMIFDEKHFVHVKRYGSASGISHLSFQAMNSTHILNKKDKRLQAFLEKYATTKTSAANILKNINSDSFNVELLILHENDNYSDTLKIKNLSIFSIIALHKTKGAIESMIGKSKFRIHIRHF